MATTSVYATTDRAQANDYINFRKGLGDNVVEIAGTDRVELVKGGEDVDAWDDGLGTSWIVLIASADEITPR